MHVSGLWRYPVKSMGGEPLRHAELTRDGVAGDRVVHVGWARGVITGRTRHRLLTVPVTTRSDGAPIVGGHAWDSPAAAAIVREATGADARLLAYTGPERFDILNLLVATDGAVTRLGADIRRLRPNLEVAGVPPEAEATWPGKALRIGEVLIGVHSLRERCVVTTIDPDSGVQDVEVLRRINREFGGELALNCWVIEPGVITVGSGAEIVECDARPRHRGGWVTGARYRLPSDEESS